MHQALYRKWRPQTFDDVCGQDHITSILRYEAEHGSFSHAYLFCGSRGTGKTTCAKILAQVVNCEAPVGGSPCGKCESCRAIDSGAATDVLEMDAASNNGVDNIRDIRDEVVYSPSALRYRVYIIDEVHMLSVSAFNALLKTLEEPPEHVIFILATTELQKLPATIISRCQRFDFRRISTETLMDRLLYIAKEEGISLDTEAARMLAKLAQGGMRDAISLLELCAGGQKRITVEVVESCVGLTGREAMLETVKAVAEHHYDLLFEQIAEVVRSSKDIAVFWQDLISLYRDMLVVKNTANPMSYLDLTDHEAKQLVAVSERFRKETLVYHCKLLEDAFFAMQKTNAVKRIVAEMTLVRMCDEALDTSPEALLSRIAVLEDRIARGIPMHAQDTSQAAEEKANQEPISTLSDREDATVQKISVPKEDRMSAKNASTVLATSMANVGGEKRVLRSLRSWMEVVERISRLAPMEAGFVKTARAFTLESGAVLVRFENAFAMQMMEKSDSRDRLRAALSTVLRREIGDRMLLMEVENKQEKPSVIDEIIEAGEE